MSDRIVIAGMRFAGRHGVTEAERALPQPLEVDVELGLDLREAGQRDELEATVDYGKVFDRCREIVERRSFRLLEAIAHAIASDVVATWPVDDVTVRVRKLSVPVAGQVASAGVEIVRRRRDA